MTGPVAVAIATEDDRWKAWVARGVARDKRQKTITVRMVVVVAAAALALGLMAQFV